MENHIRKSMPGPRKKQLKNHMGHRYTNKETTLRYAHKSGSV